jgi:uncharacterized protein (DUF58 family)
MPTRRVALTGPFFVALAALLLTAIVGMLEPVAFGFAATGAALLLLVGAIDRLRLCPGRGWAGSLVLPSTLELDATVQAELRLAAPRGRALPPTLRIVVPRFETLAFPDERIVLGPPAPNEDGVPVYGMALAVRGRTLGYEKPPFLRVVARSPWGLWAHLFEVALEGGGHRVMPPLRPISPEAFHDVARNETLLFQGSRRLLRSRSAEQFHSVRKYRYPDSLRHVDPRKSAKFGELMTRTYEAFFNHHLVLGLDLGRTMTGEVGASPRREYYLGACLEVAQHALAHRDRVSFFGFSRKLHYWVRETRNAASFLPLFEGRDELRPVDEETDYDLLPSIVEQLSGGRSLILLFTDPSRPSVQERLEAVLPALCAKHLVVVLGVVDEGRQLTHVVRTLGDGTVNVPALGRYLYSCWSDEQLELFQRRLARWSGGCLVVNQHDWMSVVMKLHELLRASMRL